ncbi:MAG: hypothetical protein ACRDRT_12870, partial [Pseudonocardiaceae bacterium]
RMLSRRLQILIDDERLKRIEKEAARRKVAVAVVVRDAIDASFPVTTPARAAAARRILDAAPMEAPEQAQLLAELEELRGRRG